MYGVCPWRMHSSTEWRKNAYSPVAEIIHVTLNDDCFVVGNDANRLHLIGNIGQQILCSQPVQTMVINEQGFCFIALHSLQAMDQPSDRAAHFERPACRISLPERHLPRLSGRWRNQNALRRDVVNLPGC